MNQRQQSLMRRLERFQIDEPNTEFTFARRLAGENGWTASFAARVIVEYKRFLFLASAAGHPVTPSEEVDQAWHLHLTYTRSYWDKLCVECLESPLHHDPTQGGAAEREKFHDWYAATLKSYQRFFGHPPPPDIWPDGRKRFGINRIQRIDSNRNWIIPKPWAERPAAFLPLAALLFVPLIAAPEFAIVVVLFIIIAIVVAAGHVAFVIYLIRFARRQVAAGKKKGKRSSGGLLSEGGDSGGGGDAGCGASGCGGGGCGGGGCGGGGCGGGGCGGGGGV